MEKYTKTIIASIISAAIITGGGIAAWYFFSYKPSQDKAEEERKDKEIKDANTNNPTASDNEYMSSAQKIPETDGTTAQKLNNHIKLGMRGRSVAAWQAFLKYKYNIPLKIDGSFGVQLRDAFSKARTIPCYGEYVPCEPTASLIAEFIKWMADPNGKVVRAKDKDYNQSLKYFQ